MARAFRTRRFARVAALAATAALVAVSCGGDDDDAGTATDDTAEATAEPSATGDTADIPAESSSADPGASEPATDTAEASEPATGEVADARPLVIARDMDTNSLDISRSYCDTCQIFNTAVYETLITVDPADPNTFEPRLATEWEANDDNTVFTFTLNPEATFADGSPVEAADVKWTWERLANLQGGASYLMAGYESIDAPDAGTVIVTFSAPNSAFLPIVAAPYLGIINSEVAAENGATADADAATTDTAEEWFLSNSAGSGPYQLDSYTQGESLVLARNDAYWGPSKPVFPSVTLTQVQDASSQLQQLQAGDVDIAMQISFDAVPQLEGDDNVTTEIVDSFNYVYIALSPGAAGAEALQDVEVRNAIRQAIDYEGAIDALVAGNGKPQASPIPNGFLGSADLPLPEYDPEAATAALEAAGIDELTLDATYPEVNVYGVDFSLMMQKVQQDLSQVGVELELTPVPIAEWVEIISAEGIPVTAVYFAPDHTDSSQYVQYFGMIPGSSWAARAGGGEAGTPIDNPDESTLLAEALAADGDAKAEAYTALGQAMIDDAIIIPIVNPQLVLATAADITGMHYSACCNLDLGRLSVSG
jgi:peptide/nickel transport system substrate-binding protein